MIGAEFFEATNANMRLRLQMQHTLELVLRNNFGEGLLCTWSYRFLEQVDQIFFFIFWLQFCFQSEFIAECYMRRAYISVFTGSAETAVVRPSPIGDGKLYT